MTQAEAELVVRLHMERLAEGEVRPTLSDVAEALKIPEQQVASMLAEIRSTQTVQPTEQIRKQKVRRDKRAALIGLSVFCTLLFVLFTTVTVARLHRRPMPVGDEASIASPVKQANEYRFEVLGQIYTLDGGTPNEINRVLDQLNKAIPRIHQYGPEAESLLAGIKTGKWESADGLKLEPIDLRHRDSRGLDMVAVRVKLPIYNGDDERVDKLVTEEQYRRLWQALNPPVK